MSDETTGKRHIVGGDPNPELYPNLSAVLAGCVSHPVVQWPGVRSELRKLCAALDPVFTVGRLPEHTSNCAFNLPGNAPCDCGASYRRHSQGQRSGPSSLQYLRAMKAIKVMREALELISGTGPGRAESSAPRAAAKDALDEAEICLAQDSTK